MVVLSVRNVLLGSAFALSACSFMLPDACDETGCYGASSATPADNAQVSSASDVREMPTSYEQQKSKTATHSLYAESVVSRDSAMASSRTATTEWNPSSDVMMRPAIGGTMTVPGKKVMDLAGEVAQLRVAVDKHYAAFDTLKAQIMEDADRYHEIVGVITSKLQVGTTKSNPVVVDNWNRATYILDNINKDVIVLEQLASDVATDEASIVYLIDSIHATYDMAGAVDADHEKLREIEGKAEGVAVDVKKMSVVVNKTLLRQRQYVSDERRKLGALAMSVRDGHLYGKSLPPKRIEHGMKDAGVGFKHSGIAPRGIGNKAGSAAVAKLNKPLVTIKFDRKNMDYAPALYQAAKAALERKPDVEFEILEIIPLKNLSPNKGAKSNAEIVRASLVEMGFPNERLAVMEIENAEAEIPEVRIFVK